MPEAAAIVLIFCICAVAYAFAQRIARDPALSNPAVEVARLRHQAAWLRSRIETAEAQNWSGEMIVALQNELGATMEALQKLDAPHLPSHVSVAPRIAQPVTLAGKSAADA